jgi:hypothetical protein
MKLPKLSELAELVAGVQADITDDCRASEFEASDDDSEPGIELTVGADKSGDWSYQTGDNSYSGGAYGYPYWAVVGVYRDSNPRTIARDIRSQLSELAAN